jgi:hypothetical protein
MSNLQQHSAYHLYSEKLFEDRSEASSISKHEIEFLALTDNMKFSKQTPAVKYEDISDASITVVNDIANLTDLEEFFDGIEDNVSTASSMPGLDTPSSSPLSASAILESNGFFDTWNPTSNFLDIQDTPEGTEFLEEAQQVQLRSEEDGQSAFFAALELQPPQPSAANSETSELTKHALEAAEMLLAQVDFSPATFRERYNIPNATSINRIPTSVIATISDPDGLLTTSNGMFHIEVEQDQQSLILDINEDDVRALASPAAKAGSITTANTVTPSTSAATSVASAQLSIASGTSEPSPFDKAHSFLEAPTHWLNLPAFCTRYSITEQRAERLLDTSVPNMSVGTAEMMSDAEDLLQNYLSEDMEEDTYEESSDMIHSGLEAVPANTPLNAYVRPAVPCSPACFGCSQCLLTDSCSGLPAPRERRQVQAPRLATALDLPGPVVQVVHRSFSTQSLDETAGVFPPQVAGPRREVWDPEHRAATGMLQFVPTTIL